MSLLTILDAPDIKPRIMEMQARNQHFLVHFLAVKNHDISDAHHLSECAITPVWAHHAKQHHESIIQAITTCSKGSSQASNRGKQLSTIHGFLAVDLRFQEHVKA
jgi:hypothetical protein